jgi:SNF2 family DNA or RNA helicase
MITMRIAKPTRCNSERSVYVSFKFDNYILNIVRSFSVRYYNPDTKEWELPISQLEALRERFSNYEVNVYEDKECLSMSLKMPSNDFVFKTKPFQHQLEGFNYGIKHDRWLLGDEQGLGKTKQAIDIAVAKKQSLGYKHCLIICGVNGLKWNWKNEINTHSNEQSHVLGERNKKGKITIGGNKDKLEDVKNLPDAFFLITNVESLRDKTIVDELVKKIKAKEINMCVADEVHKMKNPTSQQGKGFLKILPECRIAMTGTPLMNSPLDLYVPLKWLGYEDHAFYSFKMHYCVMGGFGGYEVIGYRYLDELQEKLNEIMLRRLKADVLDLPEKLHIDEYVEMTPKQAQIYKEVRAEISMNIDKIAQSFNPLAELIRLRQATGYTGILSSTIQESAKLDRMDELVDEAIANGKKVVIFSQWTQITNAVKERISKKGYHYCSITGETKEVDRQHYVEAFQKDDYCKVIIGTIGAMGTGLTLTAGTVEIFMDEPWNKALKDQAEDRCHRVGTNENITIYTLLCKDTIDERINSLVKAKGEMSDIIVDGKQLEGKELVEYLIN